LQGDTDLLLKPHLDKAADNPTHFTPLVNIFQVNHSKDNSLSDQLASCHQTDLSTVLELDSVTS